MKTIEELNGEIEQAQAEMECDKKLIKDFNKALNIIMPYSSLAKSAAEITDAIKRHTSSADDFKKIISTNKKAIKLLEQVQELTKTE